MLEMELGKIYSAKAASNEEEKSSNSSVNLNLLTKSTQQIWTDPHQYSIKQSVSHFHDPE